MQPRAFVCAMLGSFTLAFASILSTIQESPANALASISQAPANVPLNQKLNFKIRQDMAGRLKLNVSNIRIVKTQSSVFNSCLNLPKPKEACNKKGVPGWRVTLASGKQNWLYHVSQSGDYRINWLSSLSKGLEQQIFSSINILTRTYSGPWKVTQVEPKVWKNDCLELTRATQKCKNQQTLGWLVKVESKSVTPNHPPQWVYRTDLNGPNIQFDLVASLGTLPKTTIENILQNAAKISRTQRQKWKLKKLTPFQRQSCSGFIPSPPQGACMDVTLFAWEVVVKNKDYEWVYFANKDGFTFNAPGNIPPALLKEIIQTAAKQSGNSPNNFSLNWAEQVNWENSCLGANSNWFTCRKGVFPGWKIQILQNNSQLWTFHTLLNSDVRFVDKRPWYPPPVAPPKI